MTRPDTIPGNEPTGITAQVRSQAVWAAIAAAMMLYFGFRSVFVGDTLPIDLLRYTLRYGGIAMAVSAVMLFSGWPTALMLDGVFAMIIGAALAAVGVLIVVMEQTIDLQTIMFIAFGYLFFTSGLRNFRDYCRLGETPDESVSSFADDASTDQPHD